MTIGPGWPLAEIGRAIDELGRLAGLDRPRGAAPPVAPADLGPRELDRWLVALAGRAGFEAQREELPLAGLAGALGDVAPAILRIVAGGEARYLAVLGRRGRALEVLAPDLAVVRVPIASIVAALACEQDAAALHAAAALAAHLPARRRDAASVRLLERMLPGASATGVWILRPAPGELRRAIARERFAAQLAALMATHALHLFLLVGAWTLIGWAALHGRAAAGWIAAWALLLLSSVPLRVLTLCLSDAVTLRLGAFLRQRLFEGALRLAPGELEAGGIGGVLGQVFESTMIETMALSGGLMTALALVDAVLAIAILAAGAGALLTVSSFAGLLGALAFMTVVHARRRRDWTGERIRLTRDTTERMLGHRTRLVQMEPAGWHQDEDEALEAYLDRSRRHDRLAIAIGMLGRSWLLVGAIALAPSLLAGAAPVSLAIAVGGFIMASRALTRLSRGCLLLAGAAASWHQIGSLLAAAARPTVELTPAGVLLTAAPRPPRTGADPDVTRIETRVALELHQVSFRYRPGARPVLDHLDLRVLHGERVLVEGSSGAGKSTLASVMNGTRPPDSGAVLLDGLDRATLGADGWRRLASAPQFHQNHVFSASLAFNLLLGRAWPPAPGDLERAEAVCRELGLGLLLARMPSGLAQNLGESGWQLSHGEKSRLFIARALLQDADLVVLDESFASLDPDTLAVAMRCALARARTLLVIAHP